MNKIKQTTLDCVFADKYFERLSNIWYDSINDWDLARLIRSLDKAKEDGATIWFCGNGGSASTASHFANDLRSCGFRSISLTDASGITCAGNDFGYENCFVKQLEVLFKPYDIVVGISASGNSENVIRAIRYANEAGGRSIALVGFDGGKIKGVSQISLHVKSNIGEYGFVEDIHVMIDHMLVNYYKNREPIQEQINEIQETKPGLSEEEVIPVYMEEPENKPNSIDIISKNIMEEISLALSTRDFFYQEGSGVWKRDENQDDWELSGVIFEQDREWIEISYSLNTDLATFYYHGLTGVSVGTVKISTKILGPDVVDILRNRAGKSD
jgi:D-sedoheptulose 7-phosphate isomerase